MNKNRKIVAFICAMAMILSVFAGFTVVNAEEPTRGFVFDNIQTSNSGKTITLDVKYAGYELGLSSFTISANIPAAVTDIKTTKATAFSAAVDNYADGVYSLVYGGVSNATTEGNLIASLELTLSDALSEDQIITLTDASKASAMNADETGYEYKDTLKAGTLIASTATLPKYVDPDATPVPTPVAPIATRAPKPTAKPLPSTNPDATSAPTLKPDVEVTRGINFSNVVVDGNKVTLDIVYVGYALGVSSFTVSADIPAVVTDIKTTKATAFTTAVDNYADGVYSLVYGGVSNATTEGNLIASLELTLADAASDFQIELNDASKVSAMNADETGYEYKDTVKSGSMPKAIVTIPVQSTPEPTSTPTPTAKPVSKPVVLPDMDITTGDVPETTNDLYVAVVIKTKDGNDAVYGKDYVAELTLRNGDVKELTEDDLNNILNGYFDLVEGAETMTWADVISGLTFNALSDGLSFNAQLINGSEVISGGDVEVTFEPEKPEKAPAITLETKVADKKATKVSVGKVMTLTAKTDKVVEDAVYEYVISDSDKAYLEPITATVTDDVLTVKFEGKKTKSNIKITVNYLDADDVVLATKSVTVSVVKEETGTSGSGSSSSDSSSGNSNGSIAHGGVVSNNNSKVAFVDIDTVPWAEDSILALVDKGVINGRSDSIFDPNGTVTRAEFAKMVVLAFGLTGGSGVDEFSDVENTDWFASYVARGYYNGVISGYDDGTFRPNGLISRQEMAAMIARAVKAANKTLPEIVAAVTFEDANQIADWAMDAVTTLQKGGVINGMTETTYAPLENATRAQAAVIIYRAMTNAK